MELRTILAEFEELEVGMAVPLTETDLLAQFEAEGTKELSNNGPLKRLTNRHHAAARLLALGHSLKDVAIITGYAYPTVAALQCDPTFKELIEYYVRSVDDEYRGMSAQLAGLGEDAVAELRNRIENEPEKIGTNTLLDVVVKIADRTGHGPTTTTKSEVNVTLDIAARMKAAREKAIEATTFRDITPKVAE